MTERKKAATASKKKTAGLRPPRGAAIMPVGKIERAILFVRGERVILDADLASALFFFFPGQSP